MCRDAEGTALEGVRVIAKAIGAGSEPVYSGSGGAIVKERVEHSAASTGLVTFTLQANSTLTPANSYYRIEIQAPGERKPRVAFIIVPAGSGPYDIEDILTDAGTVSQSALEAHKLTVGDHGDVDLTGNAVGKVLMWDGTNFVPADTHATDLEVSSAIATHSALTTGVHGVGASTVESVAGSTAKAAAAQAAAIAASQPVDADLTTIAALDSSTAGALVTDGAGWIRKTYSQLKTALGLVKGDVGLGNVDNTSDANKPVSTATQTALDAKAATASAVMDGDAAGGVLSGTYPNPGFASDMATQAELDAHTGNTSNPHSVTKTQVGLANVTNDAQVPKSLYDANSILAATTDDTPAALTVGASRIVGRKATGDIAALTGPEVLAVTKAAPLGHFLKPTAAAYESIPRQQVNSASLGALSTGRLSLYAIALPEGVTITSIAFVSGSQNAVTPTAQWFALYDSSRALLRQTTDDTSTAWAANAVKSLNLTTTFDTTYSGFYYLGIMVAAATVPNLHGFSSQTITVALTPSIAGSSNSGLTTTAPNPANALSSQNVIPYAYVA